MSQPINSPDPLGVALSLLFVALPSGVTDAIKSVCFAEPGWH